MRSSLVTFEKPTIDINGVLKWKKSVVSRLNKGIKALAKARRIHTFIATSPIHMEYKLQKQPNEVLELIKYGQKLNIEIMPEIDLPAHSWALLEIMPELREQSSNMVSEDVGSYKNNTINPSLEKTVTFLKDMLNEVSEIFSYDVIHVGAAAEAIPIYLLHQLKVNGIMVLPLLVNKDKGHILCVIKKDKKHNIRLELRESVRFVPLVHTIPDPVIEHGIKI